MNCPTCSFENPGAMRFCGSCGAALPRACGRCGATMPVAFRFCGACGNALDAPASATVPESATRQVTVIFADISGFTALAERLEPGELHETMRTAWDAIAAEIRREGGIIEKYIGDAVVAVFGAVTAEEDHPERAQRAALAIVAALDRTNARIAQRTGTRLGLRVGLNTGLAVAGAIGDKESEFGVLGDAVNVAARLEQAAEPGEILVGDVTYRFTPEQFVYEPHPTIAAKGKSAPVIAWRLVGAAAARSRVQPVPLAGRDDEVSAIASAITTALAGQGRIVSLVGEAGSGKSRLLDEAVAHPAARGARIAAVACEVADEHRAYGTIGDILRRLLGIPVTVSSDHALRTLAETVPDAEPETRALLLGVLGYTGVTPSMSAGTRRRLIQRGVRDLLLHVASSQGLVVAIDDVHLADAASLSLLSALVPSLGANSAIVLASYRPVTASGTAFAAPWANASAHVLVRLTPVADTAAEALVGGTAAVPEPIARAIAARAAGNAAFLVECARYALESGIVVRGGEHALADVGRAPELPASLPQLVLKRLERLATDSRRVLNVAAVLGSEVRSAHLRATAPSEIDLDAALAELAAARVLEPARSGTLRFAHALLRDVTYMSTLARHREDLHGRVAQALENTSPEIAAQRPELLAYHYGASTRSLRAYDLAMRAGERALTLAALPDALHHYRAAAHAAAREGGGGPVERARALLAASDAARALGEKAEALALAEEALGLELPDGDLAAALRRRAGHLCADAGHVERAAWHLAEAERRTETFGRERAELTLAKAFLAAADERHNEALSIARAAAREARAAGDHALGLEAEEAVADFALTAGAHDEARRARERTAELASAAGDLGALARSLHAQAAAALDRDDAAEAERLALELLADESRLGDDAGQAAALRTLAEAQLRTGRYDEAERALTQAIALAGPLVGDAARPADPASTLRLRGLLALERGDLRGARAAFDEALLHVTSSPRAAHLAALTAADLARLALASGDVAAAAQHGAAAESARGEHSCRRCGAEIAPALIAVARATGDEDAARAHRSDGLEQALRLRLDAARERIERAFAAGGDASAAASA